VSQNASTLPPLSQEDLEKKGAPNSPVAGFRSDPSILRGKAPISWQADAQKSYARATIMCSGRNLRKLLNPTT